MLPNKPPFLEPMKKKPKNFSHVIINKLGSSGLFFDGLMEGYAAFYDLDALRPTPLDGTTLASFIATILNGDESSAEWKSGYVVGWSAALGECNPDYFFLEIPEREVAQ